MTPTDPSQLATTPASVPSPITASPAALPVPGPAGWSSLRELTGYHWFVFVVAALGWLADCMDQQLFVLSRKEAITELLGATATSQMVDTYSLLTTSIFLLGWATGGIAFGIMGDLFGRVKTMMLTILIYSMFTGLSSLSVSVWDFGLYRFLTGLGVGGEFAVGVALLAETMPDRARPFALGLLQAFSATGNITAAFLYMYLGSLQQAGSFQNLYLGGMPITPWRVLFLIGTVPALLALVIRRRLQEPERWKPAAALRTSRNPLSPFRDLFSDPRWRKNALLGLLLTFSGVVGLWAIGFFSPDLTQQALKTTFKDQGLEGAELQGKLKIWASWTGLMLNIGAFFGIFAFSWVTSYTGRRPTFALALLLAMISTACVFLFMKDQSDIFWMIPIMGFCQLSLFGGYAIYFPELFPTRLRSTGTSFCYNVGRFVAAVGPLFFIMLRQYVFTGPEGLRYGGVAMCLVFALGLIALPFLPETKGKPLPE